MTRGYWLLEQGSNLQALRHLINGQARLPISAIQDQRTDDRGQETEDGERVARFRRLLSAVGRPNWWNERDSNPHHPLARRGLSQLSYHPISGQNSVVSHQ